MTGDGHKDALLAITCSYLRSPVPGEVLVYDGASSPDSPVLVQALLRGEPGAAPAGLWPTGVSVGADGLLVVHSLTWRDQSRTGKADVPVTTWLQWQRGAFTRVKEEVRR
ncbi:hypothetical protein JOF53_001221 [Crossiella equi]|uniref:Uncharacterized protein n=1 Tax=Crossiella equi TaxID=130796 RepID=A0ABS5A6X4_9PSEU|nr:hypothetical protein [Crossiella equi]MBP2472349.1 hypothetical protein [Crossiella equi]